MRLVYDAAARPAILTESSGQWAPRDPPKKSARQILTSQLSISDGAIRHVGV
jgi:hypothetical protein